MGCDGLLRHLRPHRVILKAPCNYMCIASNGPEIGYEFSEMGIM